MNLPPWMHLCEVCKRRYALEPVCPVCQERAEWSRDRRRDKWGVLLLSAVLLAVWLWMVRHLVSRLP